MKRTALLACLALAAHAFAGSAEWCLYSLDLKDGNVYRTRLDGSHRELVVACHVRQPLSPASTTSIAEANPWKTGRHELHLGNIPTDGGGYTVLEAEPAPATDPRWAYHSMDWRGRGGFQQDKGVVPWTDTGKPSGWNLSYEIARGTAASRPFPATIVFRKGKVVRQFDLTTRGRNCGLLGLFSDRRAIVFDDDTATVWDLASDKRVTLARASSAAIWRRDLRKPARFKPHASAYVGPGRAGLAAGWYGWDMKDPNDFVVKAEYRKAPNFGHLAKPATPQARVVFGVGSIYSGPAWPSPRSG